MKAHLLAYSFGILFWLFTGAVGGFFAGKSNILEKLFDDKIECSLTVNPITAKELEK